MRSRSARRAVLRSMNEWRSRTSNLEHRERLRERIVICIARAAHRRDRDTRMRDGVDEVRRLLGHESLSTTLRYSGLVGADLARAHRAAGGIERLRFN